MANKVCTKPYRKNSWSYLKKREGKYDKELCRQVEELIQLLIYCKAIYTAPSAFTVFFSSDSKILNFSLMLYILHTEHVAELQRIHTNVSQESSEFKNPMLSTVLKPLNLLAEAWNSVFMDILQSAVIFTGWIKNWIWIHVTKKKKIKK